MTGNEEGGNLVWSLVITENLSKCHHSLTHEASTQTADRLAADMLRLLHRNTQAQGLLFFIITDFHLKKTKCEFEVKLHQESIV